jgi:hypothetical protein
MANRRRGRKREAAAARTAQQREEHTHAVSPTTPTGDAPHAENKRARDCEHASCGSNAVQQPVRVREQPPAPCYTCTRQTRKMCQRCHRARFCSTTCLLTAQPPHTQTCRAEVD